MRCSKAASGSPSSPFLASAGEVDFSVIRDAIRTTDGNASVHLRKLEEAGYVTVEKRFVHRKPQTRYALTDRGRKACSITSPISKRCYHPQDHQGRKANDQAQIMADSRWPRHHRRCTAHPQPGPNRFDYEVREDMFRGFFAGDKAAFARAMALCEARLAENPDHAQALVWHGNGLLFRAGEAFAAGDYDKGSSAQPAGRPLRWRGRSHCDPTKSLS